MPKKNHEKSRCKKARGMTNTDATQSGRDALDQNGSDVYQIVTDRVISLLEAGTVPWRKPWASDGRWPMNLVSRKPYNA
jgi:antirestriction protein ArdC